MLKLTSFTMLIVLSLLVADAGASPVQSETASKPVTHTAGRAKAAPRAAHPVRADTGNQMPSILGLLLIVSAGVSSR